jgi:hypothetical protein
MRTRILIGEDIYLVPLGSRRGSIVGRNGQRVALLWGIDDPENPPDSDFPYRIRRSVYLGTPFEMVIDLQLEDADRATAALVSGSLVPHYIPLAN